MRIATILVGVVAITVVPGLALFTVGERAAGAVFLLLALGGWCFLDGGCRWRRGRVAS